MAVAWGTRRIIGGLAFGMMSLILQVTAQETIYSADSLMAKFEKGSKVSVKGTQIILRDVVAESEDMKVTFKSLHNNRVICKLVTSNEDQSKPVSVGSEITVTGKVRGRGLLGNVTLDNCSLALVADSQRSANPPQDAASTPADPPSEESTEITSLPAYPDEVRNDFAPVQSAPRPKPAIRKHKDATTPPIQLEQQNQTTREEGSNSEHDIPYTLYALLVMSGAVGYWILSKLLSSIAGGMRSSGTVTSTNTDEVRKAALEELLLKSSKEK
jgi:hypothetical protein